MVICSRSVKFLKAEPKIHSLMTHSKVLCMTSKFSMKDRIMARKVSSSDSRYRAQMSRTIQFLSTEYIVETENQQQKLQRSLSPSTLRPIFSHAVANILHPPHSITDCHPLHTLQHQCKPTLQLLASSFHPHPALQQ